MAYSPSTDPQPPAAYQSSAVLVSTTENLERNAIANVTLKVKHRDCLEDLGIHAKILIQQTLKTKDRRVWSGFIHLRIRTRGRDMLTW